MRGLAVSCVLLAGCNAVFGLQATELIDAGDGVSDRDQDGIADLADNCDDVANPEQADTDSDTIGDACDPCSFEFNPMSDHDGDALLSAADNCPAVRNAAQDDSDGDGIGDACDPSTGTDHVRCFSDYAVGVQRSWPIVAPWKWIVISTASYIIHQPSDAPPFWIGANGSGLLPSGIAVQLELTTPSGAPTTNVELAMGIAVGAPDQTRHAACEVVMSMTDPTLRVRLSDDTGPLGMATPGVDPDHLTLVYREVPGGVELRCVAARLGVTLQAITATSTAPFSADVIFMTSTNATSAFESLVIYETP